MGSTASCAVSPRIPYLLFIERDVGVRGLRWCRLLRSCQFGDGNRGRRPRGSALVIPAAQGASTLTYGDSRDAPRTREADELERRVLDLYAAIESRHASAVVSVTQGDKPRRLRLSSTSPSTAMIEIVPDPGQVDIAIGREGHVELLAPTIEQATEVVRSIVDAVVEGRFHETVWTSFGSTIRAKSWIRGRAGEEEHVSTKWRPLGLVIRGKKADVAYSPYG